MRTFATVERWLNNLNPSPADPYLHYLKRFCAYVNLNLDQIVDQAKSNREAVHDKMKAFRRKLETEGSASRQRIWLSGHFSARTAFNRTGCPSPSRQMRNAGVTDPDLLDFMLGHQLPYGGAYDKFDADYIRKEYTKADPFLAVTVSPEISED